MISKKIKTIIFILLQCCLFSTYTLLIRYSQKHLKEDHTKTTFSIFFIELLKLVFSTIMIIINIDKRDFFSHFFKLIKPMHYLTPLTFTYFVINFIYFYSLKRLQAPLFIILNQLKILTTALCSFFFLETILTVRHWCSLIILTFGVSLTQINGFIDDDKKTLCQTIQGVIAILIGVILSGIGKIYFEMVIKESNVNNFSLWDRNWQLYLSSVLLTLIASFGMDYKRIKEEGFIVDYTALYWCIILSGSLMGIFVSFVIKYDSTIIKSYVVSCAIILTGIVSYFLLDFEITIYFVLGSLIVIFSVILYRYDFLLSLKGYFNKENNSFIV